MLWADGLPGVPTHVRAEALSPTTIQVSWREPDQNTQDIIGYVLHIRRTSGESPLKIKIAKNMLETFMSKIQIELENRERLCGPSLPRATVGGAWRQWCEQGAVTDVLEVE